MPWRGSRSPTAETAQRWDPVESPGSELGPPVGFKIGDAASDAQKDYCC